MEDFAHQVRKHCHECGVPMRGYGTLAQSREDDGIEFVSMSHLSIYKPKRPGRNVAVVTSKHQIDDQALSTVVDYIGNSKR
jgi:hypothetical protein